MAVAENCSFIASGLSHLTCLQCVLRFRKVQMQMQLLQQQVFSFPVGPVKSDGFVSFSPQGELEIPELRSLELKVT